MNSYSKKYNKESMEQRMLEVRHVIHLSKSILKCMEEIHNYSLLKEDFLSSYPKEIVEDSLVQKSLIQIDSEIDYWLKTLKLLESQSLS